ncbi:EamA family transporter [Phyllobacterium phragmitis]|uniref:EamA family transporter n=1 Tax=Phyllobacterium phragmitis TaxID=2670329 RepID=A0A2S9IXM1_9HYPH|nr:DMT family transporter [Phyllobacterium phragmitis]PRD45248.1 EamA family transporter [Phyllobacterium phragmitis]
MPRTRANLVLLLAGTIWGLGFVAQSTAMASIGPLIFIGMRFALAALTVLPFAIREAQQAPKALKSSDHFAFLFIGFLLFAGITAQQFGMLTTSVTNAGFLTGLYVVMVPFVGVMLFRNWPHPIIWPCALAALAGIWLLSGGTLDALAPGDWMVILGALFWALQVLFITRYANRTGRPLTLCLVQFTFCAVMGLSLGLAQEGIDWTAVQTAAPEILFTGIFSSGVAFTLQAIGQRYTTAPQAAIFLSSEALFAALFGAILLGERLPPTGFAGCALIFAAMLAVELIPMMRERSVSQ